MDILFVGIGSFSGGVIRYLLGSHLNAKIITTFPYGTMTVNLLGCLLIGLINGLLARYPSAHSGFRLFLSPDSAAASPLFQLFPTKLSPCFATVNGCGWQFTSRQVF